VTVISGCSLLPQKQIEIISKPIEIEIMQPTLPRPVDLTAPEWWVVSEAKITNPCRKTIAFEPPKYNEKGEEVLKRPQSCEKADTENPDWPDGYTYLDRFLDDMKEQNNGEVLFVGTTIGDYKIMSEDMQELKRYIKQLGEVIIYYRDVTVKNDETKPTDKD
jgi:aminopeptidase-like protein